MKRTFIAAAGFALAAAGMAAAQPRLEQTGDGYTVVYDGAERGNVVGGGHVRLVGGGDDAAILYAGPDPVREGRWATLSGGGDDAVISYAEPAPATGVANAAAPGAGPRG